METKKLNLMEKLFLVQQEIQPIEKDSNNPFFNSKYFDINKLLEVVKPVLAKHKLLILQPLSGSTVTTTIIDTEGESGDGKDRVFSTASIPDSITDPQKIGSCITYLRRYTLQSLLSLESEDDDGNTASNSATTAFNHPKGTYSTPSNNSGVKKAFKDDVFDNQTHEVVKRGFVENFKEEVEAYRAAGGGWTKADGWFKLKDSSVDDSMPF